MPRHAFLYGLPYKLYVKFGIRKYGFHGTSHRYVAHKASEVLKKPLSCLKLITCHLGNGCSIAAIKNGEVIDTSMGFTPLEGLLMGTRCGDIDAAAVLFLMAKGRLSIEETDDLLNKKSGLLGISGVSNDMRDIIKAIRAGNRRAQLALDMFTYRVLKYIGAYVAAMGGVDAVVFTAGIGENERLIRQKIQKQLSFLSNKAGLKFLVIPTNEELMIALETMKVAVSKREAE
jgi:acetate kinase